MLRNPFKRKTVADVLSQFTRTIDELRAIQLDMNARAWKIEEQIGDLRDEQADCDREADNARAVADKLEELVS